MPLDVRQEYREWQQRRRDAAYKSAPDLLDTLPPDFPVCNCSRCGGLCARAGPIAFTFGRVTDFFHPPDTPPGLLYLGCRTSAGRPLCRGCSRRRKPPPGTYGPWGDEDPLQSNAIRAWEDEPEEAG